MSSPHRILHILRAPIGGLFRHVCDLATEQARRGHLVGVVAADGGDAITRQRLALLTPHAKLGILRLPIRRNPGLADIAALRLVNAFVGRSEPTILHGHGAKGGAYARLAGYLARRSGRDALKVFYTPHGGTLHYHPASVTGRAYLAGERRLAALTDGLIFESAFAAARYRDRVGTAACPSRVIHNGLLPGDFEPLPANSDAADIVFVGELRTLKGVDTLLYALKLANDVSHMTAVIVGDGPDRARFMALAQSLGLEQRVRFLPPRPAAEALRLGRILAVPSRAESLPYVVLEAAAAAVPFVATDVGGIPEIVAGSNTTLIAPEDELALARRLLSDLADPERLADRAAALQSAVRRRFTIAAMTDAVLGFYAGKAEVLPLSMANAAAN